MASIFIIFLMHTPNYLQAQNQYEVRYKHTLDAITTIYRSEGPRAFYRGLLTSLLGISHVAIQFPIYEKLKETAGEHFTQPDCWFYSNIDTEKSNRPGQPLPFSSILGCSAVAKMIASVTTYPHEVIRTRLQIQKVYTKPPSIPGVNNPEPHYRGILQTAAKIVTEEGYGGLYKGLSINLFRTVPSSAVTMLTCVLITPVEVLIKG